MNDDAKRVQIRWRRLLFGFHLLVWLIARLAVGSIDVTPPLVIYNLLDDWALLVAAHGILLAVLDGRDHADLPVAWLRALIEPRERRWLLLALDAVLWVLFTMAIASRVIPYDFILRYVNPLMLAWLAHTAFGIFQVLLVIYAEVFDHTQGRWKVDEKPKRELDSTLLLDDDGELVDYPDESLRKLKRE